MSDSQKPRVIIELDELIEQATKERSHYYVKSVAEKAQLAIGMLMSENERLEKKLGIAKQAAEFLWDQLDEISTLGDIHKPKVDAYFRAVEKRCEGRSRYMWSDGYNLYWRDQIKEDKK